MRSTRAGADLAAFFNAGGAINVMSGGMAGRTNSARYYAFLNITRGGSAVSPPLSLTPLGRAIGWQDGRVFPGELDSINTCDRPISFELPAPDSALKVAEVDGAGRAVTLVAQTNNLAGDRGAADDRAGRLRRRGRRAADRRHGCRRLGRPPGDLRSPQVAEDLAAASPGVRFTRMVLYVIKLSTTRT